MTQYRSKEQLLHWIDMVNFMMVDLCEYLDTHPWDETALDHYHHYQELYQKALEEYAALYGPLTLATSKAKDYWQWGMQKNPWERGSC